MGRPTIYTPELAAFICEKVATHDVGLMRLCKMYGELPDKTTINQWRFKYPDFSIQYAQAKVHQADILAEECLEIADLDTHDVKIDDHGNEVCNTEFIARSRVRIYTRQWLAGKLIPKVYGSTKELEEVKEEKEKYKTEVLELRRQLDEANKKDY